MIVIVEATEIRAMLEIKNREVKAQQLVISKAFRATLFILLLLCNGIIDPIELRDNELIFIFFSPKLLYFSCIQCNGNTL